MVSEFPALNIEKVLIGWNNSQIAINNSAKLFPNASMDKGKNKTIKRYIFCRFLTFNVQRTL